MWTGRNKVQIYGIRAPAKRLCGSVCARFFLYIYHRCSLKNGGRPIQTDNFLRQSNQPYHQCGFSARSCPFIYVRIYALQSFIGFISIDICILQCSCKFWQKRLIEKKNIWQLNITSSGDTVRDVLKNICCSRLRRTWCSIQFAASSSLPLNLLCI